MGDNSKYTHYYQPAKNMGDYPLRYKFHLIDTHEILDEVLSNVSSDYVAFDTETTSLNHKTAELVGVSFCHDLYNGYYIPLNHSEGNIQDTQLALKKIHERYLHGRKVLFYNKRFDKRILRAASVPISFSTFDVQVLIWILDSNIKYPTLKWSEEHFLGWRAQTFDELTENNHSIQLLTPSHVTQYAATDALGTFHLFTRLSKEVEPFKFAVMLDNAVLDVISVIEETPLLVDKFKLEEMLPIVENDLIAKAKEIYALAGQTFNIGSPKQVQQVLINNGCAPPPVKGKVSTSADALSKLNHPLPKAIVAYKSLSTIKSSYISKLLHEAEVHDCKLNISHKTTEVPTGRIASGADSKNDFFAKVNIMSIPKPSSTFYRPIQDFSPESIFGWSFEPILKGDEDEFGVEGFKQDLNIRSCFQAPEGFIWLSVDYAAQELRLPANFSGEPVLVDPFLNGEDVHTNVAKAVFGPNITKKERGISKTLSFGLMYGGTYWTIANKLNCPIEDAKEFVDKYVVGHPVLYRWKDKVIRKSKKDGFSVTYYGRPRRLRYYYNSPDWKQVKFGERSAISSVVQGTASDILKLSLIKIYKELQHHFKNDALRFHPIVHDEINFLIRESMLFEITNEIMSIMTIQEKGWKVPMEVEASFGRTWGNLFPFKNTGLTFEPKLSKL